MRSGETLQLEARYDSDAQWWITYHESCSEICTNYHEEL